MGERCSARSVLVQSCEKLLQGGVGRLWGKEYCCSVVARLNRPLIVSLLDPAEYGSRICQVCDGGMKLMLLSATLMANPKK